MTRLAHALTIFTLLSTGALAESAAPLRARVWPPVTVAPATVRIEILIEANDDNRALEIAVDSDVYYRSSTIVLEGPRAARFHAVHYRGIPEGVYDLTVRLLGSSAAVRAVQHQRFIVAP
jgi:hypothetical protein